MSSDRVSGRLRAAHLASNLMPVAVARRFSNLLYPEAVGHRDDLELVVRLITGARIRARTGDYYGRLAAVGGFFAWKNIAVAMAVCSHGDTIIEVGANVGTETAAFRDIVGRAGRVIAVEPLPANQDALRDLISLNGWENVDVVAAAFSDAEGKATFSAPTPSNSGIGFVTTDESEGIHVELRVLDSYEHLGRAAAIFSDTEGHELHVVQGGQSFLKKYMPVYTVEVVPEYLERAGASPTSLFEEFRRLGYEINLLTSRGLRRLDRPTEDQVADWVCIDPRRTTLRGKITRRIRSFGMLPVGLHRLAGSVAARSAARRL